MLRVAILGAGVGQQHMAGFLQLPERYRVVAVCDLDLAKGEALAAEAESCAAQTDIDAVLADHTVDAIVTSLGGKRGEPRVDVPGTQNIVAAAKEAGVSRYVMLGAHWHWRFLGGAVAQSARSARRGDERKNRSRGYSDRIGTGLYDYPGRGVDR